MESKGETEKICVLYGEFQRIASRFKKSFISDQCKETEDNNRMGKTRDLFKNIRENKGTFHAMTGSIKDINIMGQTETGDIKKKWRKYTGELYKKELHNPDNHGGVITHLQPDILQCEVQWALEGITTNKASGGEEIPIELLKSLKGDSLKVLHSICQQIWPQANSAVASGREKFAFHSNHKERQCQRMLKLLHNWTHLTLVK